MWRPCKTARKRCPRLRRRGRQRSRPWPSPSSGRAQTTWGVEVFTDDGDPRLAAAIELVSPRNKDRPQAREAFSAKCADRLRHGCGLVVVDMVTTRRADLHVELLGALGAEAVPAAGSLSVVAYRPVGRDTDGRLLAWPSALEIGRPLPTVPLWLLGVSAAVPLDLEASHAAACADLRIRPAG